MKKRLRNKLVKQLQIYDEHLVYMFCHGGITGKYRQSISDFRAVIRYIARRWPMAYRDAFGMEYKTISLGHYGSGR